MKRIAVVLAALTMAASARASIIEMTGVAGAHLENFDTLPAGGISAWANDSTLPGWFAARVAAGAPNILATNGAINTGQLYSFGAGGDTDRALGSLSSGTPGTISYGVQFHNGTANTYLNLTVNYTLEQWRDGAPTGLVPQTNTFWYMISSTPFATIDADLTTGWTEVAALAGISPTYTGPAGTLDGNVASNRVGLIQSFDVTINSGDYVMLRWRDINDPSNDHGMGVDDLEVAWTTVPEPATAGLILLAAVAFAARRRRG